MRGQRVHSVEPSPEKEPAVHAAHRFVFLLRKVPSPQGRHSESPASDTIPCEHNFVKIQCFKVIEIIEVQFYEYVSGGTIG